MIKTVLYYNDILVLRNGIHCRPYNHDFHNSKSRIKKNDYIYVDLINIYNSLFICRLCDYDENLKYNNYGITDSLDIIKIIRNGKEINI